MEVHFATQPPNEFGNKTQLVCGTESLYRSLRLVVLWIRQVAHPHDHTIPLFVAGTPPLAGRSRAMALPGKYPNFPLDRQSQFAIY